MDKDKQKEVDKLFDDLKWVNERERHYEDKVRFYTRKRKEIWLKILKLEGKL